MKNLIALAFIFVAQSSFAQSHPHPAAVVLPNPTYPLRIQSVPNHTYVTGTQMVVAPEFPIQCGSRFPIRGGVDAPLLNSNFNQMKLDESDIHVTFRFTTILGRCFESVFYPGPQPYLGMVAQVTDSARIDSKRGKNRTFEKSLPAKIQVQAVSADSAIVTITFDKKRAFKEKRVVHYGLQYYPAGYAQIVSSVDTWGRGYWYRLPTFYFPWKVTLIRDSARETRMEVLTFAN